VTGRRHDVPHHKVPNLDSTDRIDSNGTDGTRSRSDTSADAIESVAVDDVASRIVIVRGRRVMLDVDLARVYGVPPKRLNEQVKRNHARFPEDFMFQLTLEEAGALVASRSQFATLKRGENVKHAPYAFTEHGAVMLAAVLKSPVAIDASIQVVRAFVRLRAMVAAHAEWAQKLDALEQKFDHQFRVVFEAIRQLMAPPMRASAPRIGFSRAAP
jgi:hypothetical protein